MILVCLLQDCIRFVTPFFVVLLLPLFMIFWFDRHCFSWQVYKILEYLEAYQKENKLTHMPIILCGWASCLKEYLKLFPSTSIILMTLNYWFYFSDWNGSKRGHVYKFLRSQGFISSYDVAHQYTDSDAHRVRNLLQTFFLHPHCYWNMIHVVKHTYLTVFLLLIFLQWVSHRNHRGNICGVDFIWLCNPTSSNSRKPLRTSWVEAVFSIIKVKIKSPFTLQIFRNKEC